MRVAGRRKLGLASDIFFDSECLLDALSQTVPLTVDETGRVAWDAVLKQGVNKDAPSRLMHCSSRNASISTCLTFIDWPWASLAHPNPSPLPKGPSQPNPSLPLATPLASISQASRSNPGLTPASITPALAPTLFGKPSHDTIRNPPSRNVA